MPQNVRAEDAAAAIAASGGELLADIKLFDVYTGDPVPAGYRSLAFALTFQAANRTLTDEEVEQYHQQILNHMEKSLSAKIAHVNKTAAVRPLFYLLLRKCLS